MKKRIYLGLLAVFFSTMVLAQEKVAAPIWNVGDKWVFTRGSIEVVGADENGYTLHFSKDTPIIESKELENIVFDKATLNRIFSIKDGKREKYTIFHRRILNFPMSLGTEWRDTFTATTLMGSRRGQPSEYTETFKVLGWEDVQVQAGTFRAIKLEFSQSSHGYSGKDYYWYVPEVKYFVKCEYDMFYRHGTPGWELVSFDVKK